MLIDLICMLSFCSQGCCVDLFLFPNAYVDVATIGDICKYTGGTLFRYNYFQADTDGERFLDDLATEVSVV